MAGYFAGLPQVKIAGAAGVDQSSISHYASRFKVMAAEYGLSAAGKEYRVLDEVEALRSLSVELFKSKLTVEEAKHGHDITRAFLKLGIDPEKHLALVDVCQQVDDPGFIQAALKLAQIENHTGLGYHQVMSGLEKASDQLPQLEEKIASAKAELKSLHGSILKSKQELAGEQAGFEKYRQEIKDKQAQLEKDLSAKMQELGVTEKEAKEVSTLKAELAKKGLDIATLMKLAKEFHYES